MSFLKYTSIIFLLLTGSNAMFGQINNIDSYQVALQQIRLISTEKSVIPFKKLEELSITHLVLGTPQVQTNVFSEQLDKYNSLPHFLFGVIFGAVLSFIVLFYLIKASK